MGNVALGGAVEEEVEHVEDVLEDVVDAGDEAEHVDVGDVVELAEEEIDEVAEEFEDVENVVPVVAAAEEKDVVGEENLQNYALRGFANFRRRNSIIFAKDLNPETSTSRSWIILKRRSCITFAKDEKSADVEDAAVFSVEDLS